MKIIADPKLILIQDHEDHQAQEEVLEPGDNQDHRAAGVHPGLEAREGNLEVLDLQAFPVPPDPEDHLDPRVSWVHPEPQGSPDEVDPEENQVNLTGKVELGSSLFSSGSHLNQPIMFIPISVQKNINDQNISS